MSSIVVNFRMDRASLSRIDVLIEKGLYPTRSAMMRSAVLRAIGEDSTFFEPLSDFEQLVAAFDDRYLPIDGDLEATQALVKEIDDLKAKLSLRGQLAEGIKEIEEQSQLLPLARDILKNAGLRTEAKGPSIMDDVLKLDEISRSDGVLSPLVRQALEKLLADADALGGEEVRLGI